jgi:hypothetical protein
MIIFLPGFTRSSLTKTSVTLLVQVTSAEEFAEAIRLSFAALPEGSAERPELRLRLAPKAPAFAAPSAPADQACNACPISRLIHGRRNGPHGGRRCCPGKIVKCVVFAIIAFRLLSFLAHHFLCLALLALPFIAIHTIKRRCARRRALFMAGAQAGNRCPFAQGSCGRPAAEQQAAPVVPNAPVEPVQPVESASFPSEDSRRDNDAGATRFQSLLEQLKNMGFHNKTKNIDALIRTNLELNRAVEVLLSQ